MEITQKNETVYSGNFNNQFVAYSDGKNIYQVNTYIGQKILIGVVQSQYDELKEICEKYYDKLVEAKLIVPPKTAEELHAEQAKVMANILEVVKGLKAEVEVLKRNENRTANNHVRNEPKANTDRPAGVGES